MPPTACSMAVFTLKKQTDPAHTPVRCSLFFFGTFHVSNAIFLASFQPFYCTCCIFHSVLSAFCVSDLCAIAWGRKSQSVFLHDAPPVSAQSKRRSCCLAQGQVTAFSSPAVTCSCERRRLLAPPCSFISLHAPFWKPPSIVCTAG